MTQKIIKAFPPNFAELTRHFPIKGLQGILYSWGDRIYNPNGTPVPKWLLSHEAVHGERQEDFDRTYHHEGHDKIHVWWDNYIRRPAFRLREEILAHRAEWRAYTGKTPELYLEGMAHRLSGPLYGNLVTKDKAKELITNE